MLKEKLKWHSLADGNWPVSDEEVLLSTIKYGTVIGYYDIGDDAFFILSGAKPQVLRINEVIAWTDIPECDIKKPTAKFRLPTQEEFDKLCKCYTRFDEELKVDGSTTKRQERNCFFLVKATAIRIVFSMMRF